MTVVQCLKSQAHRINLCPLEQLRARLNYNVDFETQKTNTICIYIYIYIYCMYCLEHWGRRHCPFSCRLVHRPLHSLKAQVASQASEFFPSRPGFEVDI